ncbi:Panacea domain-containing protein [Bordetella sp. N]|uniref:Panacea domain-containing protein n=1 Tax=Bordetella sp. N TaxID=1746199 RepID=UPI00070D56A7|nr:type II toxin-antitoxin system antitoxin SocA domain-containing protein [Bordetella sp. N]ALM83123.1 hypothetical protein ASB57_09295 [Bordetella sp. N]
MPMTALQLGSELVRRSAARNQTVTNLAVQKLAYFAHGWHLALLDRPLVDSAFEAWRYGPVLPQLYHAYKAFGNNPIPPSHALVASQPGAALDDVSSALVERVLELYGSQTTKRLVELSHDPKGPWMPAYSDVNVSSTLGDAAIRDYFRSLQSHQ